MVLLDTLLCNFDKQRFHVCMDYTESMRVIKRQHLVWILVALFMVGCSSSGSAHRGISSPSAVYFVPGQGEISLEDLQAHPEIAVVATFEDFQRYATQQVALWIDQNTTPLNPEQEKWINQAPQAYYPIVLVGTSDTLLSFRDLLRLCCFTGPAGEYPNYDAPGFSIIQREETSEPDAPAVVFLQGYDQKPTAQTILDITNALLQGKLNLTPTAMVIPAATASAGP